MGSSGIPGTGEVEQFKSLAGRAYAGAVADILDEMGFRDQVISPRSEIRPLSVSMATMGRALTLLNAPDEDPNDPYAKAIEALDRVAPGQVIVATSTNNTEAGIFGELSAARVARAGGMGAVIDGYTRDGRKLIEIDFPVFSRGISPIDTTCRERVIDYNVPVLIHGREVQPGQIVFADYDGIVVVPFEAERELLRLLDERVAIESRIREQLRQGSTMREVWEEHHVL